MRKIFTASLLLGLTFLMSADLFAQLNVPEGSQRAQVMQRVGITEITIDYGRPSVNGREIWGKLVPYGFNNLGFGTSTAAPWRAGANNNTIIEFTHDVKIEGENLAAGKYGLHMALEESGEVTIIFSNDYNAWGSYFYEEKNDALRVKVQSQKTAPTELLTFEFATVTPNSATASLKWGEKEIPFKIDVDVNSIVMKQIKSDFNNSAGFTQANWDQAAGFAMGAGELEQALEWVNASIDGNFFSKPTFSNLSMKSQILTQMGKKEEAAELVDQIIALGNPTQLYQYGGQFVATGQNDLAIKVAKANVKQSDGAWPSNYGLARAYSASGNFKAAIKSIKASQGKAPGRFKQRLAGALEKLQKGED
ncbi:MAG: DUF2911 domain-containing protein, partial [Bacteroidota bacterium]